ncbi:DUF6894 family protein [Brevundimonas sp.]|uniref:DUF6894 family protein n=1 Tax=Brevundimonas sp. TaxID=1871086 RepID=UPI0037C1ABDE
MGRFYFDVTDGDTHRDQDGEAFQDASAARLAALEISAAALRDRGADLQGGGDLRVNVRDETGATIFSITTTAKIL